ncbi:PH domain-containing protein [Actinopolyspora mortivallis]|uniref:PH domain-containing protein n=1 Tax=Actinopolyspora mortivallis TaxID=33906 RepID=UPI000525D328|nr:PH domain-containing protein [Actinopolyspora mortivallis]
MSNELRDDIAAAKSRMAASFGSGREVKKLESYLWEGERVDMLSSGSYGPGMGLVALTDRRLLFLKDGWTSQTIEDFPLGKISSVQWSAGLMFGSLTVYASGNKAEIKQVEKDNGKMISDAIRQRLSADESTSTSAAPAASQPSSDPYEQLKKLGELREQGVLSEEEFAAKKSEIMNRL